MEFVPVLYLSKTFNRNEVSPLHLRGIMKKQGFSELYVIDEQGVRRNEPRYAFYQRFSPLFNLWVDTGPRGIGDVVDDIFSGAKRIIIRENLWTEDSLSQIRIMRFPSSVGCARHTTDAVIFVPSISMTSPIERSSSIRV